MTMELDFRPLSDLERKQLATALRRTANGEAALLMDSETTFAGISEELPTDKEVVNAVKSVPTHYALDFYWSGILRLARWGGGPMVYIIRDPSSFAGCVFRVTT